MAVPNRTENSWSPDVFGQRGAGGGGMKPKRRDMWLRGFFFSSRCWIGLLPAAVTPPPATAPLSPPPLSPAPCPRGSRLQAPGWAAGLERWVGPALGVQWKEGGRLRQLSTAVTLPGHAAARAHSSGAVSQPASRVQGIARLSSNFSLFLSLSHRDQHHGAHCTQTGCRSFPWMTTSKGFYQILKVCRL